MSSILTREEVESLSAKVLLWPEDGKRFLAHDAALRAHLAIFREEGRAALGERAALADKLSSALAAREKAERERDLARVSLNYHHTFPGACHEAVDRLTAAESALSSEREAHAETRRERDAALELVGVQHPMGCFDHARKIVSALAKTERERDSERSRSDAAERQRDEAVAALKRIADAECIGCKPGTHYDQCPAWVVNIQKRARSALSRLGNGETGARIKPEDVEWVVNSIAELGVKIGDQFFFLYKGESLVYHADDDEEEPLQWRHVGKREFGECCHPINDADPTKYGTVSPSDSDRWKPLPLAPGAGTEKGETR